MQNDYDFAVSGLDGFLSRSIDGLNQATLDSPGPTNTAVAYDRAQLSGGIGDSFTVGNIVFDGKSSTITIKDSNSNAAIIIDGENKRIEVLDTSNTRVMLGQLPDTNYGWAVSKPGVNVANGF